MTSFICAESFERYAKLMRAVIPDAAGLALCDDKGQALQYLDFDSDAELLSAIDKLCARDPDWASDLQTQIHVGTGQTLLTTGLSNACGEVIAAMAILIAGKSQQSSDDTLLKAVADCVEHEVELETELTSMTHELTERYEELNLVYHTEDQVNYFRQGQEALRNLTQNCLDYLDVGLSVLILKGKGVAISFDHPDEPIPKDKRIQTKLAANLYSWATENRKTVVINEKSHPLAAGIAYRVLCCPIFESSGNVVGILATVNTYNKPKFTNSDRNLLEIMARKASKIIVANYDSLTGLMNQNGYEYFLAAALAQVQAKEVEKSLLHINIDQLHIINDTVGRAVGDEVIRSVAATINSQKRDGDTLSRLGGDEFGVLMHGCSGAAAGDFAARICREIEASTINFDGENYRATVSIGVAMITPASKSVAQVIDVAELACSVAKDQGQNRVETYRPDNVDVVRREQQVHFVGQIQRALTEGSFELYCQPIQALSPDAYEHHTEVLLRLIGEGGALMVPDDFIPAAERYHLIPSIDRWVVSKTLSTLSEFDESLLRGGTYAINLSGQSLGERDFLEFIHTEIRNSGVPPECICFEVTETAAVAKMSKAVRFMESIRDIGCSFSLDDFGSGTSSFGYLKSLPVDFLKIDGAIIRDMVVDETSAAMVVAINQVGHTMNLRTIAEYVENDAIKTHLIEIGVDYAQGFAIGKPVPFADRLRELMVMPTAVAS